MVRSAFLPDAAALDALLSGVRSAPVRRHSDRVLRRTPAAVAGAATAHLAVPVPVAVAAAPSPPAHEGTAPGRPTPVVAASAESLRQPIVVGGLGGAGGLRAPGLSLDAQRLSELRPRITEAANLEARFAVLADWLDERTGAWAVFVADTDGLEMVRSDAGPAYTATAAVLESLRQGIAGLVPNVDSGSTTLRQDSGGCIELVWSDTSVGRYTVGFVMDRPLETEWISVVIAALRDVADMDGSRG